MLSADEYLAWPEVAPDEELVYGDDPAQHVGLYVPDARSDAGPFPLVVVFHGGCWLDAYDRTPISALCAALRDRGYVVANAEFRRIGGGGGWPTTFDDAIAATLAAVRADAPIDTTRVVTLGHSAGGHLALWLATQPAVTIRGVIGLGPLVDLEGAADRGLCGDAPMQLLNGPAEFATHVAAASPAARLPIGVPHRHIGGAADTLVPAEYLESFVVRARAAGDDVTLTLVADAGHFDLVAPAGVDLIVEALEGLVA